CRPGDLDELSTVWHGCPTPETRGIDPPLTLLRVAHGSPGRRQVGQPRFGIRAREDQAPGPAFNAATTAAAVTSCQALLLFSPVGVPMSMPWSTLPSHRTPASARCASRKT